MGDLLCLQSPFRPRPSKWKLQRIQREAEGSPHRNPYIHHSPRCDCHTHRHLLCHSRMPRRNNRILQLDLRRHLLLHPDLKLRDNRDDHLWLYDSRFSNSNQICQKLVSIRKVDNLPSRRRNHLNRFCRSGWLVFPWMLRHDAFLWNHYNSDWGQRLLRKERLEPLRPLGLLGSVFSSLYPHAHGWNTFHALPNYRHVNSDLG